MTETRLHELTAQDRSLRSGSLRDEILESLEYDGDPHNLSEAFKEMTPFQKSIGRLYGKLMQARGNKQVDDCFAWFETEFSHFPEVQDFTSFKKSMILSDCILQIVGASDEGYRSLRQVLVRLNQK